MVSEQTFLDWIFKGFVAILGWIGVRLHSRLDKLEQDTVRKHELQSLEDRTISVMDDLKEALKEQRIETNTALAEIRALLLTAKTPQRHDRE